MGGSQSPSIKRKGKTRALRKKKRKSEFEERYRNSDRF